MGGTLDFWSLSRLDLSTLDFPFSFSLFQLFDGTCLPASGAAPLGSRVCGICRAPSQALGCLSPKPSTLDSSSLDFPFSFSYFGSISVSSEK